MNYDEALRAIGALVEWYRGREGNRSEATTRLQLIDTLFFDCLGWDKKDVISEEAHGREFADYTFLAPRRVLIVEAKREGDYFELPAGMTRLEMSIPALMRTYENVAVALKQAAGYCQDRGVPFGVVTNGHQLIAFVANRNDGVAPLEGRALVFASIEEMQDHFLDLWDSLSKPGVEEKRLLYRLVTSAPVLPQKLSATAKPYPGICERNVVQSDLQILSERKDYVYTEPD
jgi:predicted type IV restriction endonuclease